MKKIIGINGVIGIITIIYIIFLNVFNEKLFEIQQQYDSAIVRAYKTAQVPGFYNYFVIGIVLVVILIIEQIWNFNNENAERLIIGIIIILNVALLILLVVTFANPIFTTVVIIAGLGVMLSKAS